MPPWVEDGFHTYAKRLPQEYQLILTEVTAEKRSKGSAIKSRIEKEGKALLSAASPGNTLIALDRQGQHIDTNALAQQLLRWHDDAQNISLLIGGPEGLSEQCLTTANTVWSLSKLTLAHPLVRIIVAEQIYRAWSILSHHPYHR